MSSSAQINLGARYPLSWAAADAAAGTLAELDVRIYWHGGDGWVEDMQNKANLIQLPSTRKLVTQ